MATHSSILAWKIPWTEEPGRLQSIGSQKSQTQLRAHTCISLFIFGYAESSSLCGPSHCSELGLLFLVVRRLLIAVASILEHWASGAAARGLGSFHLQALEHRLSICGATTQLPQGMWNLPQTRDQTHILCIGRHILILCTTREVLKKDILIKFRVLRQTI